MSFQTQQSLADLFLYSFNTDAQLFRDFPVLQSVSPAEHEYFMALSRKRLDIRLYGGLQFFQQKTLFRILSNIGYIEF